MTDTQGFTPEAFTRAAQEMRRKLADVRKRRQDVTWYPYDSFGSVERLLKLAGKRWPEVSQAALAHGVLDVGCGDGDLSFLFESLGCRVLAMDHPSPNANSLKGFGAIAEEIGSAVPLLPADVDRNFDVPGTFGLTLFLGVLYHLKNPFLAIEYLAQRARFCFLSTRVAKSFPNGERFGDDWPIAYLLGPSELNEDDSNFWIFSKPALVRLFSRTRWRLLNSIHLGEVSESTPDGKDERVFCFLESHHGMIHTDVFGDWHPPDRWGWRWTGRRFGFKIRRPAEERTLKVRLYVPPAIISAHGRSRLSVAVNGGAASTYVFERDGLANISLDAGPGTEAVVECEVDDVVKSDSGEYGIIVDDAEF